jgi:hypothetical protein
MTTDGEMTKAERDQLIKVTKLRAKQAEREAEARGKILLAEVQDLLTAEFSANDRLWADAVAIAKQACDKANAQIQARCLELGIPADDAPQLELGWHARSSKYESPQRRAEVRKLAETRIAALVKDGKAGAQGNSLKIEEHLILGGLRSDEARALFDAMPTVEELMPALQLEDLGVQRWQPPQDAASQLTTPLTTVQRRKRIIARAIEANPGASDRAIAQIAGCDHKTVAAHRRDNGGEIPAITGEFPTPAGEDT